MRLNEKIYYCRKKQGLSQNDLAGLLDVSRQSVSKWETGESNPDVTKLVSLARIFDVTTDWLLSEDEDVNMHASVQQSNYVNNAIQQNNCMNNTAPQNDYAGNPQNTSEYPEWLYHLPKHLLKMVKRFGWIYGVRLSVGGFFIAIMGLLSNVLFRKMLSDNMPNPVQDPFGMGMPSGMGSNIFDSFNQRSMDIVSIFTGFIIVVGILILIGGIVLAVVLKKWGARNSNDK